MDLTIVLFCLIPVFVLPAFFLPKNKLRFYTICAVISTATVLTLELLNSLIPSWSLSLNIGKIFSPMFAFLVNREEYSLSEIYHLSYWLAMALLYFILYFILYLVMKFTYIGTNPNIHKPITVLEQVLDIVLFLVSTYGILFLFLCEIRQLIPLQEGMFAPFFSWLYPLEA